MDRITKFLELPNLKRPPMGNDTDHPVVMENCMFTWVPLEMEKIAEKERQEKEAKEAKEKDMQNSEKVSLGAQSVQTGTPAEPDITSDANKSVIPMTAGGGPTLHDITFSLKKGSLTAVVGLVGSGKSSLLNSILGELDRLDGSVEVNGRISYTAQTPFIINATVRDNILFGMAYDRERYKKCIKAAALLHDLRLLGKKDCM